MRQRLYFCIVYTPDLRVKQYRKPSPIYVPLCCTSICITRTIDSFVSVEWCPLSNWKHTRSSACPDNVTVLLTSVSQFSRVPKSHLSMEKNINAQRFAWKCLLGQKSMPRLVSFFFFYQIFPLQKYENKLALCGISGGYTFKHMACYPDLPIPHWPSSESDHQSQFDKKIK